MKYKLLLFIHEIKSLSYEDNGIKTVTSFLDKQWAFVKPSWSSFMEKDMSVSTILETLSKHNLFLRKTGFARWEDEDLNIAPISTIYFNNFIKKTNRIAGLQQSIELDLERNNQQPTIISSALRNILKTFPEDEINNFTENQLGRLINQEVIKLSGA